MATEIRARIQIENSVQEVGFRSIVTAILIENGINRAKIVNDKDDIKTVNVILEENKETLNEIREILKIEIENSRKEIKHLPKNFTVSKPQKVKLNPHDLPRLSPYGSDALQLRQMCKFVGVGTEMSDGMVAMVKSQDKMVKSQNNMAGKMDEMSKDMKNLPKNLATELADLKKKGVL